MKTFLLIIAVLAMAPTQDAYARGGHAGGHNSGHHSTRHHGSNYGYSGRHYSNYAYSGYGRRYYPNYRSYSYVRSYRSAATSGRVSLAGQTQIALAQRGYYRGAIDGIVGTGTRRALRNFQHDEGLPVTGRIDVETLDELNLG